MKKRELSMDQQQTILSYVRETADSYSDLLHDHMEKMLDIYKNVASFKTEKVNGWDTDFKVNKMFEIENKVLPRVTANSPKRITSLKTDEFNEGDAELAPEERSKKVEKLQMAAEAIRDYLTYSFNKNDFREVSEIWAKQMIRYGTAWAKVSYKISTGFKKEGEGTVEYVTGEAPIIDTSSRNETLFDPRYIRQEDMPCIIQLKSGVRMSYFTKQKDRYINLDKLYDICSLPDELDEKGYRSSVLAITGIDSNDVPRVDKNNLSVKKYYGYFEMDDQKDKDGNLYGEGEKLYEFWTINDTILVYRREITQIPFEAIRCFLDTETFQGVGFLEGIMGLQRELNFKKNSSSQYINQALNRNWVRSPNSGIDPRQLTSAPGNIIQTSKDAGTAMNNLIELPHRALPSDYFNEQNDFERQIQGLSFTVDTSNQKGNQALTNTATGIRVKAFESNSVIERVRENYEKGLEMLAYKFLQETFENIDDNITIKRMGDDGYWEVNKAIMAEAIRRYDIRVESGSTGFDSKEDRRSDAIAKWNIAQQAMAAGVPVDLEYQYKALMQTFDNIDIDKLLKKVNPMSAMQGEMPGSTKPLPMPDSTNAGDIPL